MCFFIFSLLDVQHAAGKTEEAVSKHVVNDEKSSTESVTKPIDKKKDEEEKRKELDKRLFGRIFEGFSTKRT